MPEPNAETANAVVQEGTPDNKQPGSVWGQTKSPRGRSLRVPLVLAMMTAVVLISLRANGTLLKNVQASPVPARVPVPSWNETTGQPSRIELPSAVQAAFDERRGQGLNASLQLSAKLDAAGAQDAKPVGSFQTQNCIDPHPGVPQTRSQQIDNCHVQVWLTYNDGCAGYKITAAPGATCPNTQQSMNDGITWTRCVAKHSS